MTTKMTATRAQAVAVYRATLALLKITDKADFDAHIMHIVDCPQAASVHPDRHGRVVHICLSMLMGEFTKRSIQISPETLEWGGLMSGNLVHDEAPAKLVVEALSSKVGLTVKFHGHHIHF